MKRESKRLFETTRPGERHALGREFRRSIGKLDKHPLERIIHGEVKDPNAKRVERKEKPRTIVHRAKGIERAALARPRRTGKTAKDKASGSWGQRFKNRDARVEWQHDNRATNGTFPG